MKYRNITLAIVVFALVATSQALPATAAPHATYGFATLPSASHPVLYTSGHEADVVFTANSDGTVSEITGAGVVTAAFAVLPRGASPCAMTTAPSGMLIVADRANKAVDTIDGLGRVQSIPLVGAVDPCGVTTNSTGHIFVVDDSTNVVSMVSATGTVTSPFAVLASDAHPKDIVADATGTLYTANTGNDTVSRIDSGGVVTPVFASLVSAARHSDPVAIAVNHSGALFTANAGSDSVSLISTTGAVSTFASFDGGTSPIDISVDESGNVLVANAGTASLALVPASGGAPKNLAILPAGEAVTGLTENIGVLYSGGSIANQLVRIPLRADLPTKSLAETISTGSPYLHEFIASGLDPITYATIPGSLPPGITLDASTGTLSGNASKPGIFTFAVYAANSDGSSATTVRLTVVPGLRPHESS